MTTIYLVLTKALVLLTLNSEAEAVKALDDGAKKAWSMTCTVYCGPGPETVNGGIVKSCTPPAEVEVYDTKPERRLRAKGV